jgi:Tfp pilus assembly protein PilN
MIKINLVPGPRRKKSSSSGRPKSAALGAMFAGLSGRLRDKFMIAAAVAVVVGVGAVAVMFTLQARESSTLAARQDQAVRDSTRYNNFLKDRFHAEAVRDTLLRQVNMIRSLDDDRYVWPHIMDEVSRALPQYTWLTMLAWVGTPQGSAAVVAAAPAADTSAAAKKRPKKRLDTEVPPEPVAMRLTGRTVDIQALTRFMRDLAASPFLSNVQLEKSELAIDQGKEVTQFQLTLAYRRPDTTALRRVPLSLSVR